MVEVNTLLRDIENKDLVLPEFQRDYVWNKEDVKLFFQSLYKNYPTGSLLIWKTINPPKIRGDNEKREQGYTRVLLDGQQRLTTLYFMLKNKAPPYYENEDFDFELYFNVENEEFRYYQKTIMEGKNEWISVKVFYTFNEVADFIQSFATEELQTYYFKWMKHLSRLSQIRTYDYFVDEEKLNKISDLKQVVKIFNLVNKQGRTLTEEDLALAYICVYWPEIKDVFREIETQLEAKDFYLDFNFFVLCINAVATGHAKFFNFEKVPEKEVKEAWEKVRKSTLYLINLLHDRFYIDSDERYELTSDALLVPFITYLAKNDCEFKDDGIIKKFQYWFYSAMLWGRYTRRGKNTPLEQDIVSITASNNPASLIDNLRREVRNFEVKPNDIELATVLSPFFNMSFILAKSKGAIDWFNGSKLHNKLIGDSYDLNRHHIFPKAMLKKIGYYKTVEGKRMVNEIANRAFLTERANKQILSSKPIDYLPEVIRRYPEALNQQMVSTNAEFWKEENYEEFLKLRRRTIADEINTFLKNILPDKIISVGISELIKQEESDRLEFKSTFTYNLENQSTDKNLKHSVLKTIIGFMNSSGGTLIIGVSDDHQIIGLEKDYEINWKHNKDGFILDFRQYLTENLGQNNLSKYIQYQFHKVDGKEILEVNVIKSLAPFYIKKDNKKVLYYRDENRTDYFEDPEEIQKYMAQNWEEED